MDRSQGDSHGQAGTDGGNSGDPRWHLSALRERVRMDSELASRKLFKPKHQLCLAFLPSKVQDTSAQHQELQG